MLGDARAELGADRPVQHGDTAERRDRVRGERTLPGLLDRRGHRDAARVRVLDDHGGRQVELAGDAAGSLEVVEVVVGERLAAELLDPREQMAARSELAVVGGRLVRVLAVGEVRDLRQSDRQSLRERLRLAEPVCDRRLVRRRRLERLAGEPLPRPGPRVAVRPQLREDVLVLARTGDDGDVREVLRRRTQHRRAADVDHLHDLRLGRVRPAGRRREGIERDADEVDRLDLLLLESQQVLVELAAREDAGVDARMQRLDAAAEHLGGPGDLLDGGDGQAGLGEERGGSPGRDELPAELHERARKEVDALLVVDADQCAARQSSLTTSGSRRCSAAWMRARSVSTVSPARTGTLSAAMTGPVSMPASM